MLIHWSIRFLTEFSRTYLAPLSVDGENLLGDPGCASRAHFSSSRFGYRPLVTSFNILLQIWLMLSHPFLSDLTFLSKHQPHIETGQNMTLYYARINSFSLKALLKGVSRVYLLLQLCIGQLEISTHATYLLKHMMVFRSEQVLSLL